MIKTYRSKDNFFLFWPDFVYSLSLSLQILWLDNWMQSKERKCEKSIGIGVDKQTLVVNIFFTHKKNISKNCFLERIASFLLTSLYLRNLWEMEKINFVERKLKGGERDKRGEKEREQSKRVFFSQQSSIKLKEPVYIYSFVPK